MRRVDGEGRGGRRWEDTEDESVAYRAAIALSCRPIVSSRLLSPSRPAWIIDRAKPHCLLLSTQQRPPSSSSSLVALAHPRLYHPHRRLFVSSLPFQRSVLLPSFPSSSAHHVARFGDQHRALRPSLLLHRRPEQGRHTATQLGTASASLHTAVSARICPPGSPLHSPSAHL